MTIENGTFNTRDEAAIRDSLLRTVANLFGRWGLPAPNTLLGSELYIRATAFARQLSVTEANAVVAVNNQMPDSAQGVVLGRWLSLLGLSLRPAGGSAGNVTISCNQQTSLQVGDALVDTSGLKYQVTKAGLYNDQDQVPVASVDGGTGANHENGDVLRWVITPSYCSQTVSVGLPGGGDGLVGGVDAENPQTAQQRMFFRLSQPMGGGNSAQVAGYATDATPIVQAAFVYPAANGPGTLHVAAVRYASTIAASNARNRDVDAATMNGIVAPFVSAKLFEGIELVITTVANRPVDVALGLTLPSSPAASPPGPGGGWVDAVPWPYNSTSASSFKCSVTAVASTTRMTVDAPTAPVPGVSRVAWVDPSTWSLNTATVLAFSGTPGAYSITIDTPWPNLPTSFVAFSGAFVFPQATNQDTYLAALLAGFAGMGPGEKTNAAGLVSRASRKPLPSTQYPNSISGQLAQSVTDSDKLVAATTYLYRADAGGTLAAPYAPPLPGSIDNPPNQWVPRNIAWYPTA